MRKLKIAAASAVLIATSMFGVAHAADATAPATGPHAAMHGMRGDHGPWGLGDIRKLHDQLKLDAQQEQAWQQAVNTSKQNRDAMRKNGEQFRQMIAQAKDQPVLDLAGMRAAREKVFDQNRQLRSQTEDAWLNVYNGLNNDQKTLVSTAIKARWAKMKAWHDKAMQHRGQMHKGAPATPAPAPAGQAQ
ncbi:periplasmic heavy metal sensor [Pandoraea fibrosis]|uniref:Periplasmic heavy metal sensor n=1 Tax=Pandoraea fibrosis TaxID=1891094 RepID=A0ABX6HKF8_9BURK|nr:periplasmic heavy metal sensor [Pandoraea fibrosis]QHE90509.1 periplasmic heavy metal sensor [Pandoraea fibrosis]QHF11341.1 periplasmic heavy metal sensor [Pandoraea fibrosis]